MLQTIIYSGDGDPQAIHGDPQILEVGRRQMDNSSSRVLNWGQCPLVALPPTQPVRARATARPPPTSMFLLAPQYYWTPVNSPAVVHSHVPGQEKRRTLNLRLTAPLINGAAGAPLSLGLRVQWGWEQGWCGQPPEAQWCPSWWKEAVGSLDEPA